MSTLKQISRAHLDSYEMEDRTFDSSTDSWRVSVVDGIKLNVDQINLPEGAFKQEAPKIEVIKVPELVKQVEIHQVNVPVIIKEYEKVEIPVLTTNTKVIEIEKPIIVKEIQVVEIEKPVIVKETEIKILEKQNNEIPMIVKVCLVAQSLALFGILLANLLKH